MEERFSVMMMVLVVVVGMTVSATSMIKGAPACDAAGKAAVEMIEKQGGTASYRCMRGE